MERALVVFFALASITPAAEPLVTKTPCQPTKTTLDCAVLTNNLGSTYFAAGNYREAELLFQQAIELFTEASPRSDDLAKAFHNLAAVYHAEGRNTAAAQY